MTDCEKLDNILRSRKISRRQLALKAGISPSSFQSAMARNTTISLDMLIPICSVLNIPIEEFRPLELLSFNSGAEFERAWEEATGTPHRVSEYDTKLLYSFKLLNEAGQEKAVERVQELTEIPKYRKE